MMKWLIGALTGRGGRPSLVLIAVTLAALAIACATPSEGGGENDTDEVIGKPPPAEDDPFFVESEPGSAVPVSPRGRIGEDGEDVEDGDDPQQSVDAGRPQCFSCVRICPVEGDCERAKEDVICGWGVHGDKSQAQRMARAECDATLDMAREMPVWSEISGQCPAATCR